MSSDLPDYTKLIAISVAIPDIASINTGRYVLVPVDLEDEERTPLLTDIKGRLIVVQKDKDRTIETLDGKFVRVKGFETDEVPSTVETLAGKFVRVKGFETDAIPVTLGSGTVIVSPQGGVLVKGSVETTSAYQTLATYTPTEGKTFQLSKIVISAPLACVVKFRWNGTDISCERTMDDKTILIEHFPYNYYPMVGDGVKAFDIRVMHDGATAIIQAEIVGEEV